MIDALALVRGGGRAVGHGWAHFFGDGVQPASPTPHLVVSERPHATLRRYLANTESVGDPILLVPPLAVSIDCFDLRPQQSLAAYLLETGRPVYVIDYGTITFADRAMGFEDWIDGILPTALREVSGEHGGRPVDVVTWSLGGTLTLLCAASHDDLPLRSIAMIGTPIDYSKVEYLAPIRSVGTATGGRLLTSVSRAAGGLPSWAVRFSFKATALQREITKPWFIARNLHDAETMGRMEAVDRFIDAMPGYPGRQYLQMYQRLVLRNELLRGTVHLGDRAIALADVTQDVLVVAGKTDVIAPVACVMAACDVLTGVRSLRAETAPGSHLGVLTGPEARDTTWIHVSDFLESVAS